MIFRATAEEATHFEVGETQYLDITSGEWSLTVQPPLASSGTLTVSRITQGSFTFDACPSVTWNRRARRAAKSLARKRALAAKVTP